MMTNDLLPGEIVTINSIDYALVVVPNQKSLLLPIDTLQRAAASDPAGQAAAHAAMGFVGYQSALNESTGTLYKGAFALLNAVAAMSAGQLVVMGPGLHDLDVHGIMVAQNGLLIGPGPQRCTISSTTQLGTGVAGIKNNGTYTAGGVADILIVSALDGAYLSGFSIYGALKDIGQGAYQGLIGYSMTKAGYAPAKVLVENVWGDGNSDCAYANSGAAPLLDTSDWTYRNCRFRSRFDVTVIITGNNPSNAKITHEDCALYTVGSFGSPNLPAGASPALSSTFTNYPNGDGSGSVVGSRVVSVGGGSMTIRRSGIAAFNAAPQTTTTPIFGVHGRGVSTINLIDTNIKTSSGTASAGLQLDIVTDVDATGHVYVSKSEYATGKVQDNAGIIATLPTINH